jgi:hypothetical protein
MHYLARIREFFEAEIDLFRFIAMCLGVKIRLGSQNFKKI